MFKTVVRIIASVAAGVVLTFSFDFAAAAPMQAHDLYIERCSECHHPQRLGQTAPPLLPRLFSKSARGRLGEIIRDGLPATAMPGYKDDLTAEQIELIVKYIQTPVDDAGLKWTIEDIRQSREESGEKSARSVTSPGYDPENVTLVMERGTKSLVVLEGSELERSASYLVGSVHGGPKFSYSLKDVYSVARDGLVTTFNIPRLATDYRLKAGISSRSIAVSDDDQTIAVVNYLPSNIVFFNDQLEPVRIMNLPGKAGGFYSLPGISSFVLSFRERPELWLIKAGGSFGVEKLPLPAPFEDFSISPVGDYLLGTKRGSDRLYIYDYNLREVIAQLPTSGLPHLASATFWMNKGELFAGVNHIKKPVATVISLKTLKIVASIPLPGAGFFVRTHSATPYLWIDTETEKIALIDKNDFNSRKYLTPHQGRKAMHVEFTKDGRLALVTVPGKDGEVVVYDSVTLNKEKTLPFNRPVGKYNATNKTYPARALGQARHSGQITLGKEVFDNYCMGCHHQTIEAFGPSLAEIASLRTGAQIRHHIVAPRSSAQALGYGRNSMPRIKLAPKQLSAIITYIRSF